ncbi:MAG: hypothetical protein KDI19_14955 [Pseudomonadales bacterium]|nr:hypothetical protein [Pseudomonadales bacterium]
MSRNLLLIALALACCFPAPALAWGETGHRLICQAAYDALSDKGKAFVKDTLALGEELDGNGKNDFASACLWPDSSRYEDYKGTYEQHFINIPRNAKSIDFARDCAALDCIAVGIQRNLTYLAMPASGKREKARKAAALRFLGHFIGDLHEPLHVSHGEDWGGNKIKVRWFDDETNLHAVWDTKIVEHAGLKYPESVAFIESIPMDPGTTNVLDWMRESFKLARTRAYAGVDDKPVKSGDVLGDDYFERSKPIVIEQIRKASVRLAWLIDKLAEGRLNTNILIE